MPPRKKTSELCDTCWPDGWPAADTAATCEHGEWSRPEPADTDADDTDD